MAKPYIYTQQKSVLSRQWAAMKILRQSRSMEYDARKIIALKASYQQISDATNGVPWYMIGVIDSREGGISKLGHTHLHCGDSLDYYTRHVPAGRPHVGHGPPFTFFESAVDALRMKGFQNIKAWPIERQLFELQPYNGLGYFYKNIPSPYLWSCTNQYDPPYGPGGKYVADGVFSRTTVDSQIGCAPQLWYIAHLEGFTIPAESTRAAPSDVIPEYQLDVTWLQESLNKLVVGDVASGPLVVDGALGPKTKSKTAIYQQQHPPLVVDGVAGPLTLSSIKAELKKFNGENK
jgi:lysozyme family protein